MGGPQLRRVQREQTTRPVPAAAHDVSLLDRTADLGLGEAWMIRRHPGMIGGGHSSVRFEVRAVSVVVLKQAMMRIKRAELMPEARSG
jgi:hypothetical protein